MIGLTGIILNVVFLKSHPSQHPFISKRELAHIKGDESIEEKAIRRSVPWRAMLTSRAVIALTIDWVLGIYGSTIAFTFLPLYLNNVLHVSRR